MSVLTIFREAPVLVYHLEFCRAVTPTKKPESRRVSTKQLQKIGDETSASSPNFNLALACASLLQEHSTFFGQPYRTQGAEGARISEDDTVSPIDR